MLLGTRACVSFFHQGVVTWVLKKAGPPAIELQTVEAAMAFEKENRLLCLRWKSFVKVGTCRNTMTSNEDQLGVTGLGMFTDTCASLSHVVLYAPGANIYPHVCMYVCMMEDRRILNGLLHMRSDMRDLTCMHGFMEFYGCMDAQIHG